MSVPVHLLGKTSRSPIEVANLFSEWFSSVNAKPIVFNDAVLININDCVDCKKIDISISEVFDSLASLNCTISSNPDSIPTILLNYCTWALTKPINLLYNLSLKSSIFPKTWKASFVTLVWKSGDRSSVTNYYRPISKLNFIPKLFEKNPRN